MYEIEIKRLDIKCIYWLLIPQLTFFLLSTTPAVGIQIIIKCVIYPGVNNVWWTGFISSCFGLVKYLFCRWCNVCARNCIFHRQQCLNIFFCPKLQFIQFNIFCDVWISLKPFLFHLQLVCPMFGNLAFN